jgi:hypothetical protein
MSCIVIFKNGAQPQNPLFKETIHAAFALDEEKFIFSCEGNPIDNDKTAFELYTNGGIQFYGEDMLPCKNFTYENYALIKIEFRTDNKISHFKFVFRYNKMNNIVITKYQEKGNVLIALHEAITDIILAARFASWEEYQKVVSYNKENEKLKKEVEKLRIENSRLNQEIENLKFLS